MRRDGATWDEVAQACGYDSRGSACRDLTRAAAQKRKITGASLDEWRAIEDSKLDDLEEVVWGVLTANHVVVQGGKVVYDGDESEVPLKDLAPILNATDRLLRIAQRRAALRGLDSPVKIEQSGVVRYTVDGVDMSKLS